MASFSGSKDTIPRQRAHPPAWQALLAYRDGIAALVLVCFLVVPLFGQMSLLRPGEIVEPQAAPV